MTPRDDDLIEAYTRPRVVACTLWLHGLGVNAADMDGIISRMRRSWELGLHHVAPNAPLRPITVNAGRHTRAWFDVTGDPADTPVDREGIEESTRHIHRLLDRERARGIASRHTILGGFSQGGALALHAGLRYPHGLGGIVVLSGELLLADELIHERDPANIHPPVLMIHGRDDPIIPLQEARHGRDLLVESGHPVTWHELPMGHGVLPEEIEIIDAWSYAMLAPAAAEG